MKTAMENVLADINLLKWEGQVTHGFFNRHGGYSPAPFDTNNVSHGVGDTKAAISENRETVKSILGIDVLLSAHQVHGNYVYSSPGKELEQDLEVNGFDALVTNQEGVGLMIQQADCQAVLLYDPISRTIAAIHCGWRGSVVGIIESTMAVMQSDFGVRPENVQAAVSPSLGPCCSEFINYRKELPKPFRDFQVEDTYFDFWEISRWQLTTAGVSEDSISLAKVCTSCSADYFSYRRARRQGDGITGRNCSVIALKSA